MYTIEHKTSIELDADSAGKLVAQLLKEDFEFLSDEINETKAFLVSGIPVAPYCLEDYNANIEFRNAMQTLMRYYMTHNDYMEFMELQRVYGNV